MIETIKLAVPFPPSSNMAYPTVKRGKKLMRVKSDRYKEWLRKCPELDIKLTGEFTISYHMYFPDNIVRDGQSYMKLPLDYLVKQGVLEEDNRFIVRGEQWIDCGNDKENPRIEINIRRIR